MASKEKPPSRFFQNQKNIFSIITSFAFTSIILISTSTGNLCAQETMTRAFQKGMCYATWEADRYASSYSDKALEELRKTGAEWVSIVVTWYQKDIDTPHITPTERTPSDESIRHVIKKSHELGFKVMLKLHVDLESAGDGYWRGDIFFYNDEDWKSWFSDYKRFAEYYASIAENLKVEILCIGTELSGTSNKSRYWDKIIEAIRDIYHGQLTYASNWDEYMDVPFWQKLDYIGIDAYFPLAKSDNPSFEELRKNCEEWVKKIEGWAKELGRPIIFTEVGYSSSPHAPKKPWQERCLSGPDLGIQAKCYKALLETVWGKEWLAGLYWWKWHPSPKAGGPNNVGYTPQNKPALEILREWYTKT